MNLGIDNLGLEEVENNLYKTKIGVNDDIIGSIEQLTYDTLIKKLGNFISLDISVTNTGWLKVVDGVVTHGANPLVSVDDLERRQEFKRFLKGLAGDVEYDYILIEDVIGSCNFKTAKSLMQLNPIADDMIYDGIIKCKKLIRIDNKEWKKHLKKVSGYKPKVVSEVDKTLIVGALKTLGFPYDVDTVDRVNGIAQDIFDAYGMACGVSYKLNVTKDAKTVVKNYDVAKKREIKQYESKEKAWKYLNRFKKGKKVTEYSLLNKTRDLKFNFKSILKEEESQGTETDVYLIEVATDKIGVIALEKGMDLNYPVSYLVVFDKK